MGGDECSDFKNPIGRTFLSGNRIFAETGLRRELSRTKVSAIREALPCGRGFTCLYLECPFLSFPGKEKSSFGCHHHDFSSSFKWQTVNQKH